MIKAIGSEVIEPDDGWLGKRNRRDTGDAARELVDVEVLTEFEGSSELINFEAELLVGDFVIAEKSHGMHSDVVGDDGFNRGHANPFCGKLPPTEGFGRAADGEIPSNAGIRNIVGIDDGTPERWVVAPDSSSSGLRTVEGDFLSGIELVSGVCGAEDGGDFEIPAEGGGLAGPTAEIGDESRGIFEERKPGLIDLAGHQDGADLKRVLIREIADKRDFSMNKARSDSASLEN